MVQLRVDRHQAERRRQSRPGGKADDEQRRGRAEGGAPGGAGGAGAGVVLDGEAVGDEREEIRREIAPPTQARHGGHARSLGGRLGFVRRRRLRLRDEGYIGERCWPACGSYVGR
ncbi:hypothetical protein E2562_032135 [Oryza meyeriana var. granulata]|uniref:Uncharacterized protein n=1 Tax=Oryza meyeriana var. granulata TaxID=110450 RepID=A0A6G1CK88_9ORYZ|nr:hypothetical protein E2562_032135 [Oryza meyeriana var. granulata]